MIQTHSCNIQTHTYLSDRTWLLPMYPQETDTGFFPLSSLFPGFALSWPPLLSPSPSFSTLHSQSVHKRTHRSWHIHFPLPLPPLPSPSLIVSPRTHIRTNIHALWMAASQLLHRRKLLCDPHYSASSLFPCISECLSTTLTAPPPPKSLCPISVKR